MSQLGALQLLWRVLQCATTSFNAAAGAPLPPGSDGGHAQWLALWSPGTPAMVALVWAVREPSAANVLVRRAVEDWIVQMAEGPQAGVAKLCVAFCTERMKLHAKAMAKAARQQQQQGVDSLVFPAMPPPVDAAAVAKGSKAVSPKVTSPPPEMARKMTVDIAASQFAEWIIDSAAQMPLPGSRDEIRTSLTEWCELVDSELIQQQLLLHPAQETAPAKQRCTKSQPRAGSKRSRSLVAEVAPPGPPTGSGDAAAAAAVSLGNMEFMREGSTPHVGTALVGGGSVPSPLAYAVKWERSATADASAMEAAELGTMVHDAFSATTKHGTSCAAFVTFVTALPVDSEESDAPPKRYVFDHHFAALHRVEDSADAGVPGISVGSTLAVSKP